MLTARQLYHPKDNFKSVIRTTRIPKFEGQSKILTYVSLGDGYAAKFKGKADRPESEIDIFEAILISVVAESSLSMDRIRQQARTKEVVRARQVIAWIARWTTQITHKKIGIALSDGRSKHHSTIIHCIKCAFDRMEAEDEYFMDLYNRVIGRLLYMYGIDVVKFYKPDWYLRMVDKND